MATNPTDRDPLNRATTVLLVDTIIVEGDIRDVKLVAEAVQGIDPVFHQAAIRICANAPKSPGWRLRCSSESTWGRRINPGFAESGVSRVILIALEVAYLGL